MPALRLRASLRKDVADLPGAIADAGRALDVLEGLRAKAAPRDAMKQSFVDQHRELFDLAIALQRDSGDAAAAFDTAERGRARAFQDLLASRQLQVANSADASVELASAAAVPPTRANAVLAMLGATQSTMVAYWVATDETTIWVASPTGVTATRVAVNAAAFEKLARQIWQLTAPATTAGPRRREPLALPTRGDARLTLSGNPHPALRELYRLLIAPVEARLPRAAGSLLTVVPHGPIFAVPFAALERSNGQYLVETYRTHYLSAAALLRSPAAASPGDRGVLLVADPEPMPTESGRRLPPLPGARAEVQSVAALLPPESATLLLGASATEPQVRNATNTARAVHLATHGVVSDEKPFESYLALAPDAGSGSDGRLTTGEVYSLRISADVVVLSGCRTATGRLSGDGVHGLARAFFYAGAPAVVATLWDLPDAPARQLFPGFYREWLAGSDRSTALRAAQLSLIRMLRRGGLVVETAFGPVKLPEHPAVWASPVLLGQP